MRLRALLLACLVGCTPRARPSPARWSDEWILEEGARYLRDDRFRRASLERSLVNPQNTYSRQRLGSYGLGDRGWDALPEWTPRSVAVSAATVDAVVAETAAPLWSGRVPAAYGEWIALGRRVFYEYPLRAEPLADYAVRAPSLAARVGVQRDARGEFLGVRRFRDVDGVTRTGITCALCHTAVEGGAVIEGRARRDFDYGALRNDFQRAHGGDDGALRVRMASWGPGRADVTEDDDQDPVAIPDLWGLRAQTVLTQAGTIRHESPVALAIRTETQLLHANHERVRPPRALAFALAVYLYSLTPPRRARPHDPRGERGRAIFQAQCAGCHRNAAFGGPPVRAARVGTDPALANGHARGTGRYRPPALLDLEHAAPLLHDGTVASLDELLSPDRLSPSYTRGARGPGAVPGHEFGTELSPGDKTALTRYLLTL